MIEIRPLTALDLPAVGGLLDALLPRWGGDRGLLAATVLEHPWADPELGSLVAVAGSGAIVGFVGAQARRLRFGEHELRGVCCSHLVVAPDRGAGPAGALLLGRLLRGPQDLTWSDSANETVVRIWRTFGGQLDHARACDWMLVLRPLGWLRSFAAPILHRRPVGRDLVPVGALPVHIVARRPGGGLEPEISGADASAADVVEQMSSIRGRTRLWVDYDEAHLGHLFEQIRAHSGELVCRLVRRRGIPIGWYAYLPRRASAARVLHLAARDREVDAVLGELIADARGRGVRVLAGRAEPHLDPALRRRLAAIGFAREPVVHAKDPELRAALSSGSSLLTQLDSEWFVT